MLSRIPPNDCTQCRPVSKQHFLEIAFFYDKCFNKYWLFNDANHKLSFFLTHSFCTDVNIFSSHKQVLLSWPWQLEFKFPYSIFFNRRFFSSNENIFHYKYFSYQDFCSKMRFEWRKNKHFSDFGPLSEIHPVYTAMT